jgi:hypothetical protein
MDEVLMFLAWRRPTRKLLDLFFDLSGSYHGDQAAHRYGGIPTQIDAGQRFRRQIVHFYNHE